MTATVAIVLSVSAVMWIALIWIVFVPPTRRGR